MLLSFYTVQILFTRAAIEPITDPAFTNFLPHI